MRDLFLLLILSCIFNAALGKTCEDLLTELANGQSVFVSCTTHHALPVEGERLCAGCKAEFDLISSDYSNLMSIDNCSRIFKDADRMNIVFTTQNALKGVWDKAYCEDCFRTDNLLNFTNLYMNLENCLNSHKKNECVACLLNYIKMNDFYKNLDNKNNGQICYDMQDMMNRTRVKWSKELQCCQREVNLSIFLISVGLVAGLPIILFYSTSFVLTKRREANHGLLNETEPALDAPSTANLITAATLSTPTDPPAVVNAQAEKIAKLSSPAEDSDDSSSGDKQPALKPKST